MEPGRNDPAPVLAAMAGDVSVQETLDGALDKLSDRLWRARFILETRRGKGDPSAVFLGDLANLVAEYDIRTPEALREQLEKAWMYEDLAE